jgi:TolB-like protein
MGEVYRARDPRLARDVALKVLPAHSHHDEASLRRFEQEAKAVGALNHPNLLTVFDTGRHQDSPFIVFELLDGQTLRARLAPGGLPHRKAIDYAVQIANGLAAAHERGIVHRDLKPENVFLTEDGRIKILDFGLAKLQRVAEGRANGAGTSDITAEATVGGTAGYMAPEQVQGLAGDHRSDIFAFGAVLYEIVSGRRAFGSRTAIEAMYAVLNEEPAELAPDVTVAPALERIIRRCLEKQPEARFQSARDIAFALEDLSASPVAGARPMAPWQRPSHAVHAIAVLPLVNVSGDRDQDYFADGMTDALIADLARMRALRVISRTSVMRYQGTRTPLRQIANELNVDVVVEGSVLRVADRVRITARLVDAMRDQHIWADTYERDLRDVLRLHAEVAQTISRHISASLTPQEKAVLAAAPEVNPEAHQHYLMGRYHWNKRTPAGLGHALDQFALAIEADPGYAPAYAGIADSHYIQTLSTYDVVPPREGMPRAKTAALKALEIDETLAEAHVSLANVMTHYEWDRASAAREYQRALELDPNYVYAYHCYASHAATMGSSAEAIELQQAARQLDPFSVVVTSGLARHFYFTRDYDRSIALGRISLEMESQYWVVHLLLGMCHLRSGRPAEAVDSFQTAESSAGTATLPLAMLGAAYGELGREIESQDVAERLEAASRSSYVPAYQMAVVHTGRGDKERAMQWLEKAYDERSEILSWLRVDPFWDRIRSDTRFEDLARRVGLP